VITPTLAILHFYTYYSVETMQAHHKDVKIPFKNSATISSAVKIFSFINNPYGGPGGIRTPVQNNFLKTSTNSLL